MKNVALQLILFFCIGTKVFSQLAAIDVYEQQIKTGASRSQELYYGFAGGDQIVFSINEINNAEISEVEITEYPMTTLVKESNISKIENKIIKVNKKAIFKFVINNKSNKEIVYNLKIQRIPESNRTKSFNTNIVWTEKTDTTFKTTSADGGNIYDTTTTIEKVKELVKSEKKEEVLLDKKINLNISGSADYSDKSTLLLQIPVYKNTKLLTKDLISWTYWIGAGKESEDAFEENNKKLKDIKSEFSSPLSAYATGLLTELKIPSKGDLMEYCFVNNGKDAQAFTENKEYAYVDKGKGVVGYGVSNIKKGTYFIGLRNLSKDKNIEITVKVIALVNVKTYKYKENKKTETGSTKAKPVDVKEKIIKTIRIPKFAE